MAKLPEVCVSLYSHSVQDLIREAGRAAVALADSVEIRFDQLWLIPRSARETDEEGEQAALEETIRPLDDVDVDEVKNSQASIATFLQDRKADLLTQITTAGQVNDEVKANLKAALDEYKSANK